MHDWEARPAIRAGAVLMRDELDGQHTGPRRVFWLLDEGIQLIYEPFGWVDEWYVDMVRIEARRDGGQLTYHVAAAPGPGGQRTVGWKRPRAWRRAGAAGPHRVSDKHRPL
jgi:hypothetical protein